MNLCYPADLRNYGRGTIGLFFPDVPEAATVGKTKTEVLDHAADALVVALSAYVDDGRPIPSPSCAKRGQPVVCLPPLAAEAALALLGLRASVSVEKKPSSIQA